MNHFREESNYNISHDEVSSTSISFLAHSSDIDDLLEGLDGVLEDWLDGLHDTESSLHIVNLRLHALDGLHLSGDLNEWLSVIESLEDSGGKGLLDVLDGSGLGNGGVTITSGLGSLGGGEGGLEVDEELILGHGVVLGSGNGARTPLCTWMAIRRLHDSKQRPEREDASGTWSGRMVQRSGAAWRVLACSAAGGRPVVRRVVGGAPRRC